MYMLKKLLKWEKIAYSTANYSFTGFYAISWNKENLEESQEITAILPFPFFSGERNQNIKSNKPIKTVNAFYNIYFESIFLFFTCWS